MATSQFPEITAARVELLRLLGKRNQAIMDIEKVKQDLERYRDLERQGAARKRTKEFYEEPIREVQYALRKAEADVETQKEIIEYVLACVIGTPPPPPEKTESVTKTSPTSIDETGFHLRPRITDGTPTRPIKNED
jgi:hypothetical protein